MKKIIVKNQKSHTAYNMTLTKFADLRQVYTAVYAL